MCDRVGLRSAMGAGYALMNDLTIIQTTQVTFICITEWSLMISLLIFFFYFSVSVNETACPVFDGGGQASV